MKSIFPTTIDGDLLKLVHLSNGFRVVDGAKPLQVGGVCNAEARITSVTNTDAGKVVKVKGHIYRAGIPVVEVVSAFLYRGRFTDYENTFEITEEPDYIVDLVDDAAVGVLQSKEWFEWDDESVLLQAGTALIFRVQSEVTFKDKASYRNVSVSGDIFVRDQLKRFVKVGSVDFQQDDCQGNPIVAYIQRHGTSQGRLTPLVNDGYTLTSTGVPLCLILLSRMNLIRKFRATLIPSTSILTSQTTRPFLVQSLMVCGRAPPRGSTLRTSSHKVTPIEFLRKFI
jgi:fatty acid synthase subunit alpha, fungi type